MRKLSTTGSIAVLIASMFATAANLGAAEPSVSIVPGEYEMSNDVVDETSKQCFTTDRISASTIRDQMGVSDDNQCEIVGSEMSGENLILDMACKYEGEAEGTGRMTISSTGEQLTVKSVFTIKVEGQERSMEMTGKGKRIGGC